MCMRSLKFLFLLVFAFGILSEGLAQYENTSGQKQQQKKKENVAKVNRWFAGGMIGGGWSNYGGYFEISPLVGYKVTPNLHVGTRLTYIYSSYKYGSFGTSFSSNTYGGSLFTRYTFLKFLYAQAEFEVLSYQYYQEIPPNSDNFQSIRNTLTNLYLGGGLYQSFGNGFATIGIFWNLLEDPLYDNYYSNPFMRISFGVGF